MLVVACTIAMQMPPPAHALRIISLAPSVTETLFAVGAGAEVVGVSTYCDWPPEARTIDRVGTFLSPNLEAIVAKRPDLVIAVPSPSNRDPVTMLRQIGVKALVVNPQSVADIQRTIEEIAGAVGRAEAGAALVARIKAHMAETTRRLEGAPPIPVLMVVGQTPLVAVGQGVFQDELIRMAHGINVAAAATTQWPHLSIEFVLAEAPEVIIDTTMGTEEQPAVEAAQGFWRRFTTIPAVRHGRIHGYREYALLRPGPRIHEAFRAVARFIHPQRFDAQEKRQKENEK